jgi:signal transduction histidine kinase
MGIDEMVAEIRKAQDELHAFAQGTSGRAGQGWLTAAVPDLAARSSVPVALDISIGRVAPALESAVYFLCAEALTNTAKHASAQTASVPSGRSRVTSSSGSKTTEVARALILMGRACAHSLIDSKRLVGNC